MADNVLVAVGGYVLAATVIRSKLFAQPIVRRTAINCAMIFGCYYNGGEVHAITG
jgi:hypothetical protein